MKIVILKDGIYNDQNNNAQELKAGMELETKGWYAKALVGDGFATFPKKEKPVPIVEEPTFEEEKPLEASEAARFTDLPGITEANEKALHEAGILTEIDLLQALSKGTLINVPTIGIKKAVRLKEHFGMYDEAR